MDKEATSFYGITKGSIVYIFDTNIFRVYKEKVVLYRHGDENTTSFITENNRVFNFNSVSDEGCVFSRFHNTEPDLYVFCNKEAMKRRLTMCMNKRFHEAERFKLEIEKIDNNAQDK